MKAHINALSRALSQPNTKNERHHRLTHDSFAPHTQSHNEYTHRTYIGYIQPSSSTLDLHMDHIGRNGKKTIRAREQYANNTLIGYIMYPIKVRAYSMRFACMRDVWERSSRGSMNKRAKKPLFTTHQKNIYTTFLFSSSSSSSTTKSSSFRFIFSVSYFSFALSISRQSVKMVFCFLSFFICI